MFSALVCNGRLLPSDTPDVLVPWWSVTKTVLAATALSLVRDGLTTLDAPVAGWPFTLRQLLRHEAGLADYGELPAYHAAVAQGECAWAVSDMLQRLEGARLRYTPGTHWRYSNVGYWHVGMLIEQLTGLPLEDAVSQRVLHPWVYRVCALSGRVTTWARIAWACVRSTILPGSTMASRILGGPLPGRPWVAPGYGLGVMKGTIAGGRSLCGHTGCGPDSVIALYRVREGAASACCAAFGLEVAEGVVEAEVVGHLAAALPT